VVFYDETGFMRTSVVLLEEEDAPGPVSQVMGYCSICGAVLLM